MSAPRRAWIGHCVLALCLVALVEAGTHLPDLPTTLTAVGDWIGHTDPVVAAVALARPVCIVWLSYVLVVGLVLHAAVAARRPRLAATLYRGLPSSARLIIRATGLGIVVSAASALAPVHDQPVPETHTVITIESSEHQHQP